MPAFRASGREEASGSNFGYVQTSSGGEAPQESGRRRAPDGVFRWVTWLGLAAVLVAVFWALLPYRMTLESVRDSGKILYAAPANGDHMYYASMMLQFTGVPYDESLDAVSDYFRYPGNWRNARFLNPDIAPLVYPRTVLPLMGAIAVPFLGVRAIFVPGIICGIVTVVLTYLAARRWRAGVSVFPALVWFVLSAAFESWGSGLFTESVLMTVVIGALLCLPMQGRETGRSGVAWLSALTVVASLTRQAGLILPLMCLGAALGDLFQGGRDSRQLIFRRWAPFVAASTATGVIAYLVIAKWAPYDPLPFMRHMYPSGSLFGSLVAAVGKLPSNFLHALSEYGISTLPLAPFVVLGLTSVLLLLGDPLGWAIVGASMIPLATAALNGSDPTRYLSPIYPLLVVAQAVVLHRLLRRRLPAYEAVNWQGGLDSPRLTRRAVHMLTGAAALTAGVVVLATVLVYQGAPRTSVGIFSVKNVKGAWPLSVPTVTATCGADNGQIFIRVNGRDYALSGTALARRGLMEPSASVLRRPSSGPWGAQSSSLLHAALAKCPGWVTRG